LDEESRSRAPPAPHDARAPLHQLNPVPLAAIINDRSETIQSPTTMQASRSVAHQPELLSPTYRYRVHELSAQEPNTTSRTGHPVCLDTGIR
jgi:hypothetical protein